MRYVTSVERYFMKKAHQEGMQEGLLEGIALGLRLKFGEDGLALLPEIQEIQEVKTLETILKNLETSDELESLRRIYHH